MEKTRRRGWRKQVFGLSAIIFAASFIVSLVPSIRAIAEGAIFKIKSAEITQLSSGVDGAISSHDDSTIVSDVTFHKLGDTATYKVVLQNTDSKDHVIETISDDNANSHISYSYDKHANETIAAGSNLDFVFEAKYVKTPNTNERQQVSKVKFSIRFTDIDEPEEVIVAPSTYDGLGASFVVLAISSLGLIVCAAIYVKNHKKAAKILTAALVVALATAAITSVKAATVEVNSFTLTTNYGFYDKVVITYTDKNGDEQELISNYNEPANIPDQSKDGYTLTGWEDEQGNPVDPTQPITEDVKIHPIYRTHTYTIKFNGNGATGSMTDIAMTYDETKTLPANAFNFPGRTYAGWDTEANGSGVHYDNEAEVKNLTTENNGIVMLYAQWSVNPFHINYDGNGATSGEMATTNCEYDQACQLRDNVFEKTGYHFIGWKYNNNDYANKADVKNIIESGTITMVAQWETNHYTIVFNINTDDSNAAGDMADMTNLEYGQDYTLTANAFTRTGYNFGGWNTEIDGRNFGLTNEQEFHNLTTTDNAIITLYAQWNPIHYTIVFHQNSDGVTGNMSSQVFTYDEAKNLTQNAFIKNHYKFMGWTTVANGTGTKYDDRASIFNLTTEDGATIDLYAQWKERTAYLKGTVNNSWGSAGDMIRSLQGYSAATSFSHYEGEPNFDEIETKYNMAISSSNFPVYTWIDGETIYWWSEAETIYAHEDSRNFFSGLKKAETIDYSGFNFSLTKNLAGFFRNTTALSTIDLSPLAAANPTTLEEMFYGSGIASVDLSPLDTTQTINMKGMFDSTTALETVNLSAIDTTNVTDMSYLFNNSTNLKSVDFSHNNLSSVENMSNMFRADKKLESLNFTGVNTPNLKKMSWMFGGAKIASLDLSDLDTGNVTHFDELFYSADVANLDISGFDTHNATTFGSMFTAFNAHGQVLDLSHFDTASLNYSMYEMFNGTNASVIDLSSFDISAERAANIGMANILHITNSVETIYATEKLHFHDYSSVSDTNLGVPMDYGGQSKLVGGAGSTLPQLTLLGLSEYDKARIDDPDNGKPGMFTIKGARYIRYNGNGADNATPYGTMTSEYLKTGDSLKPNAFTRASYTFAGWNTQADGNGDSYSNEQIMSDLTESKVPLELYAQWTPNTFTVIFHHTSDEVSNQDTMTPQVVTYDAATTIKPNTYEREHYKFMGWATNATQAANANTRAKVNTAKVYDDEANITNAVTENNGELHLYAIWLERTSELNKGFEIWWGNFRGNNDIVSFEEYTGDRDVSTIESRHDIALSSSNFPTYLWMETDEQGAKRAYWWSEAEHPKMNSDIRQMFDALPQIERIDLSGFIFPNATVMSGVFRGDTKLTTVIFPSEAPTIAAGTSMAQMFSGCKSLENLNMIKHWDFSNIAEMDNLFSGATSLKSLESIKDWNVSNVKSMSGMFKGSGIESVAPIKNWNVNNVENMNQMFMGATKLTSVDLSNWHTSGNLKRIKEIFAGGIVNNPETTLEIDLSGWNTSNVIDTEIAFGNGRITELDVSGWDMSSLVSGPFMFGIYANNIETIYYDGGSLPFDSEADTHGIFRGDNKLVGGAGSTGLNQELNTNARLDDPCSGKPGYFTWKNHQYICFNANYEGSTATAGQYVSTISPDQLESNPLTRPGYVLVGWAETADGEKVYDNNGAITLTESVKSPKQLYAVWVESSSMLHSGLRGISDDINSLAGDDILDSFEKYNNGTPDIDNLDAVIVSTNDSIFPTYIWREGNKVYWWSEADKVYMNPESGNMFYAVRVKNVSLVGLDSSKVTNLSRMFQGGIVESVNFGSDFDTSHVTTMGQMFWRTTGITSLDLSSFSSESLLTVGEMFTENTNLQSVTLGNSFTLSDVTSMASMFNGCSSLESIDLSKVTFENVTTVSNLFSGASALTNITLGQNINAEKLTDASSAFKGTSSLETLDLSSFHAPNLANMSDMFRTTGVKNLDLSNLGATSITNIHEAFWGMANLETIDISNLKLSGSQSPAGLFFSDSKLTAIYANYNTDFSSATSSTYGSATRLRGGAGTAPVNNPSYLRIDDPDDDKPGVFTLRGSRYIRYHDNDGDTTNDEANLAFMKSEYLKAGDSLKKNAFTRSGYVFTGWKDADNNEYTDEQVMADLTESKTPLELYAQWDAAPYTVTFDTNGGEVLQSTKTVTYLQPYGELPTPVKYDYANSILGGKYSFKEWNTKADGSGETITSSSIYENTDDTTLYAIWNDHFTVTIYNGESETPTTASYGTDDIVYLRAQDVAGKQFLYWEVDGAKKAYTKDYSMRMFQGKDLTIRAIYGSESDLESQQPGTYISDIYRQYSDNKVFVRSYSYVPDGYEIVKAGVVATLDADIANGTFDDQTATYPRAASVNGSSDNYYYTWSKSNVASGDTVYVKAYLIYKDTNGVEHTVYGDLVTATLTE